MIETKGILSDDDIRLLIKSKIITAEEPILDDQIQPASLDLRLGKKAYRIRASFMPGQNKKIENKLSFLKLHEIDLTKSAVLETGCVYIVPLLEKIALPEKISALTNPKSSTGRLDIFTRVIFDGAQEFDKIPQEYVGPLFLEISPRTFPIVVRTGSRLTQIRFQKGNSQLKKLQLYDLQEKETLISGQKLNITEAGLALSVDLNGNQEGVIGYKGKRHTSVIDVDCVNRYKILDFWEPIYRQVKKEIILDPGEFYILVSSESVYVPANYAAEMIPFDPLVGEFRVHYAGFFDPGFGFCVCEGSGSRAVLEVRCHTVPFILENGQIIGRLVYEKMLSSPSILYGETKKSHYQSQGLKLSKHFLTE